MSIAIPSRKMNVDAGDSALNSHICFNALATLQHIKNVENCK